MSPASLRTPSLPVRAIAGITLLVLASLFSTVKLTRPAEQFVYKFTGITEIVPDGVTAEEARFEKLRRLLPPHVTLGYVTDQEGPNDIAAAEEYLVVRYTLAPLLMEHGAAHDLVVGNILRPTTDIPSFLRRKRVVLLHDFGNGVLLLRGTAR